MRPSHLVRLPQSEERTDDNAQATQSRAEVITAIEMLQCLFHITGVQTTLREIEQFISRKWCRHQTELEDFMLRGC